MALAAAPFRAAVSASLGPRLTAPSSAVSSLSAAAGSRITSLLASRTSRPLRTLRTASLLARQLAAAAPLLPLLPALSLSLPSIPSLLEGIWESILRAVPKKKTSHMKKRHRQMAGKALKDVNSLCKCPACGRIKRMHHMCPYCMESIREMLKKDL